MSTITTELRAIIGRMQDGMTVNREKLARECLAVCNSTDRLEQQLATERAKNEELARQLAVARNAGLGGAFGGGDSPFKDIFGDVFKPGTDKR